MKRHACIRIGLLTIAAILSLGFFAVTAQANPVSYLFTGTGSFSIDDGPAGLDNADFRVFLQGDTANVQDFGAGLFVNPALSGGISLFDHTTSSLLNTFAFADPFDVFLWQDLGDGDPAVGFMNVNDFSEITFIVQGQGLSSYDLQSYFGPVLALSAADYNFGSLLPDGSYLALSNLVIDEINPAEFSAVPVPGAILLLGSGLAGLAGLRRRLQRKQG